MLRFFKRIKGTTLIDVIVSMTILGIITVPLLTVFSDTIALNKKGNDQIDINAVARVVKENVVDDVKASSSPLTYSLTNYHIISEGGFTIPDYYYDVSPAGAVNGTSCTYLYKIKIKKRNNLTSAYEEKCNFNIMVNTVPNIS